MANTCLMHIKPQNKAKERAETKGEAREIERRKIRRKSRAAKKSRKIKNWHTGCEKARGIKWQNEMANVGQLLRYPLSTHTHTHLRMYIRIRL